MKRILGLLAQISGKSRQRSRVLTLLGLCGVFMANMAIAQSPQAVQPGIEITPVTTEVSAIRMAFNPVTNRMMLLSIGGDISSFDITSPSNTVVIQNTFSDHGVPPPTQGFAVSDSGVLFVVGNDPRTYPGFNVGIVKRGIPDGQGGYSWETVFVTVPYPRSGTNYDHNMNAVVIGPNGSFIYVNSGSRTDHGEIQDNNGQFPGLREVPLTSVILKIPADATDLVLENDYTFLNQNGYIYSDGVRNSFSMAFDKNNRLYATDNSGDRDDSEELNLLEEGSHQGFPWKMGLSDNPMQFAGYQPNNDLLLNPEAGAVQGGYFYNDPNFPSVPQDVEFSDPVVNMGPDANLYRDSVTGEILDASVQGNVFGTFTSHRSPLGLVFDKGEFLPAHFKGDGFVLSWTGSESPLLSPFVGEGEDLLHLDFDSNSGGKVLQASRIATGFINPIDAVLIEDQLYVLEYGTGARVWKVEFSKNIASEEKPSKKPFEIQLFPNPVTSRFKLHIDSNQAEHLKIELVTLTGRVVKELFNGIHTSGILTFEQMVPSSMASGVYLVVVSGLKSGRRVRKLIIL